MANTPASPGAYNLSPALGIVVLLAAGAPPVVVVLPLPLVEPPVTVLVPEVPLVADPAGARFWVAVLAAAMYFVREREAFFAVLRGC
jgi:hypothetical protein